MKIRDLRIVQALKEKMASDQCLEFVGFEDVAEDFSFKDDFELENSFYNRKCIHSKLDGEIDDYKHGKSDFDSKQTTNNGLINTDFMEFLNFPTIGSYNPKEFRSKS